MQTSNGFKKANWFEPNIDFKKAKLLLLSSKRPTWQPCDWLERFYALHLYNIALSWAAGELFS